MEVKFLVINLIRSKVIEDPTKDPEYVTPQYTSSRLKLITNSKEEESEADAIERIKERFDIPDRMDPVAEGTVRMIVSGPQELVSLFGVETVPEEYDMLIVLLVNPQGLKL